MYQVIYIRYVRETTQGIQTKFVYLSEKNCAHSPSAVESSATIVIMASSDEGERISDYISGLYDAAEAKCVLVGGGTLQSYIEVRP